MDLPAVQAPMTAAALITRTLRDDILAGRLRGGDPLPLDALAQRFGTSVIPIREALRVLEAERLVLLRPHHTARVSELSMDEIFDVYRVRMLIDVEAVRLAAPRLTTEDIGHLRELVDLMEKNALGGRDIEAFSLHAQVHFGIYERAGSPTLLGILEKLWDDTERYRHAVKYQRSYGQTWVEEHRRLIDLLERGNAEGAAAEMLAHIRRTYVALKGARPSE